MLVAHICVAVFGVLISSLLYARPSRAKYFMSLLSLTLTLMSGTVLVFTINANLAKTCLSGLLYVSFVSIMIYLARQKLASENSPTIS